MNKVILKNKIYFIIVLFLNVLFLINFYSKTLPFETSESLLFISIILGILSCLSLCALILLFINKKAIKKRDIIPLGTVGAFYLVICGIIHMILKSFTFTVGIMTEELIYPILCNYYLLFLIVPNVLLNIYCILISVDKK